MDGAGFWAVKALFEDFDSFPAVFEQYEAFSGTTIDDIVPLIKLALRLPPKGLESLLSTLDKRRAEVVAGAVACQRVVDQASHHSLEGALASSSVEQITEDGFEPNGTLRPGDVDPTGYAPLNAPQTLAGITDCDGQIVDIGRWQPLCIPETLEQFGTPECTQQEFAFPWAGRFTTFVLEEGDETTGDALLPPPPPVGSAEFERQFRAILEYGLHHCVTNISMLVPCASQDLCHAGRRAQDCCGVLGGRTRYNRSTRTSVEDRGRCRSG